MCPALLVYTMNDLSSLKNNCVPLRLSCVHDVNNDYVRKEHHKRRMYDNDDGTDVGITLYRW
jgi:hypothetical protein